MKAAKKEPCAKQGYKRHIYLYSEIIFEGYYPSVKPLSGTLVNLSCSLMKFWRFAWIKHLQIIATLFYNIHAGLIWKDTQVIIENAQEIRVGNPTLFTFLI